VNITTVDHHSYTQVHLPARAITSLLTAGRMPARDECAHIRYWQGYSWLTFTSGQMFRAIRLTKQTLGQISIPLRRLITEIRFHEAQEIVCVFPRATSMFDDGGVMEEFYHYTAIVDGEEVEMVIPWVANDYSVNPFDGVSHEVMEPPAQAISSETTRLLTEGFSDKRQTIFAYSSNPEVVYGFPRSFGKYLASPNQFAFFSAMLLTPEPDEAGEQQFALEEVFGEPVPVSPLSIDEAARRIEEEVMGNA